MAEIEFSKEEKDVIIQKLQDYFKDELDQEIGNFDALFLLDFMSKEIGAYFYNRGLYDAQAILKRKLDDVSEAIFELEKITGIRR
ncbi:conserved hypothetical protein [Chloroherpeton thalassium ATCC 35110]|uniref:DUF2164 domain-containing protein n=1 Tax=Chloroherpeton thalassium (strain ATCC 35110 / GB-78) TaxID=517418 RepID=B3QVD5_CHLT3|nr:DUF2164 domain-containing protein [Chloroherpeton thalassium]ACF14535.1 conserved hypothetical protein [Chloroherpeton thalassium ATCC 35110]